MLRLSRTGATMARAMATTMSSASQGGLPVLSLLARIAVDHRSRFVTCLPHDMAIRRAVGGGLRREAGAQRVASILLRWASLARFSSFFTIAPTR
jgi:hypothetical protein